MTGDKGSRPVSAWGRLTADLHRVARISVAAEAVAAIGDTQVANLPIGLRRSYGDVCLNGGGQLLDTAALDRFISADWRAGMVVAEAGLTIDDLLRVSVPKGWFIPVTPGTRFVTLGGAVANDVHGKNHHQMGTIGRFIRRLVLARSDGEVVEISAEQRPELFAATIGGLGLTGVILQVELSMSKIGSAFLDVQTLPMSDVDDFFRINAESEAWPYTVAWVDCFATGAAVGRGLYMRGRPLADGDLAVHGRPRLAIPFALPSFLLNPLTIRGFNAFYRGVAGRSGSQRTHYGSFFYPLDSIASWNNLYGSRGFYQFQCVVPTSNGPELMRQMLSAAAEARQGSFLIVLKTFGDLVSPGILSFPRPGVTLALDFPNKGPRTLTLVGRLNAMAIDAGGRIYPAKDATMTGDQFRTSYPRWEEVERLRDPGVMSDFWRRMTGTASR
ncbi:FAD-binding oxidoreductase [Rhodopseudomonas sp. RCAM05734]|uniref:FAD-binding oxidoreductase n=1 Tax=Rhodopseudomonas sp. RCAM05734 TaxID=3457549 RepID=UPI004043EFBE